MIKAEKQRRQSTLIIGAAGAIGKRLCEALTAKGHRVIASDRMDQLPGSIKRSMGDLGTCVGNIDVRDMDALRKLFQEHADSNTTADQAAFEHVRASFSNVRIVHSPNIHEVRQPRKLVRRTPS